MKTELNNALEGFKNLYPNEIDKETENYLRSEYKLRHNQQQFPGYLNQSFSNITNEFSSQLSLMFRNMFRIQPGVFLILDDLKTKSQVSGYFCFIRMSNILDDPFSKESYEIVLELKPKKDRKLRFAHLQLSDLLEIVVDPMPDSKDEDHNMIVYSWNDILKLFDRFIEKMKNQIEKKNKLFSVLTPFDAVGKTNTDKEKRKKTLQKRVIHSTSSSNFSKQTKKRKHKKT